MNKTLRIILALVLVVLLVLGGWFWLDNDNEAVPSSSTGTTAKGGFTFENPKKSAHYESNAPGHGSVLAGVPVNVVIDFNFDLAEPSTISISSNGKEYGVGDTNIDDNKLSMRRNLDPQAPDGLYTVTYKACWPDSSCHDGSFQFAIDHQQAANFIDKREQAEITIKMSEIKFQPENLRITKGTKVTWVNDDSVDHFVNTDSHPAHTHQRDLNSRSLKAGESYSYTFSTAGLYPYHCSAHAENMVGNILVN
jgi:plastocyanin